MGRVQRGGQIRPRVIKKGHKEAKIQLPNAGVNINRYNPAPSDLTKPSPPIIRHGHISVQRERGA